MTSSAAARFELRAWGERLGAPSDRLRALTEAGEVRESTETYVVSTAVLDANPKARAELLDIKVLVDVTDGFERWTVHRKEPFPVDAAVLTDDLLPLLGVAPLSLERGSYPLAALIDEVVEPHPELAAVRVRKRRQLYTVGACAGEVSQVTMVGRMLQTIAIESTDLDALREVRGRLGLETYDNVSYPRAIREALGGRFAIR